VGTHWHSAVEAGTVTRDAAGVHRRVGQIVDGALLSDDSATEPWSTRTWLRRDGLLLRDIYLFRLFRLRSGPFWQHVHDVEA
jgi:hypothetical protein